MIREPVVEGQFYPHNDAELRKLIKGFGLKNGPKISARGIILPHAGYLYSGRVAATTVSKVLPRPTILILGPNHTGLGPDFSLWARGSWRMPSGLIEVDEALAEQILSKGNCIKEDDLAHKNEHSIEVELPIIHHFFGDFKFVPISCKISDPQIYEEVSSQIFEAIKNKKNDILLVASTDLTHYEPESCARRKDRAVIEAIVNLEEEDLLKKITALKISMCGAAPVAIFISCLKKLGARKSQVALYETSAAVSGDLSSVVGYVGMIVK